MTSNLRPASSRHWRRRAVRVFLIGAGVYLVAAYLVLPALWSHYEHNPRLQDIPMITRTAQGIPGDPLNVGLVGSKEEVVRAMHAAGWYPADPITLRTSAEIAASVLLDRPDPDAPVSNLYYQGRHQDLAFEQPVGSSADERNHVRFWHVPELGTDGGPLWLGSATFDRGVGVSHLTGQVTHHIGPDIDAERDKLMADLTRAHLLLRTYQVTGVGPTVNGRNGEGDRYYTDGELTVGVLAPNAAIQSQPPIALQNPPAVTVKNRIWSCCLRPLLE
jgi:hypothetical protein